MDIAVNEVFRYREIHDSHCDLAIGFDRASGQALVLFRERRDNPGMSVTNASETLAGLVWPRRLADNLQDPHGEVRWFECYPGQDHFDEIKYIWDAGFASKPRWSRVHDPVTISRLRSLLEETLQGG